jgi:hypothetical protein
MTPIAQMDCCTMLGVGPKTLRNWLRHAHLQFVAHPTDARLKCLTASASPTVGSVACSPSAEVFCCFPGAPGGSPRTRVV